jgi:hypothetical protein
MSTFLVSALKLIKLSLALQSIVSKFQRQNSQYYKCWELYFYPCIIFDILFKGKTRSINVGNCISIRVLYLIFCSKAKLVVLMLGIVFLSMYKACSKRRILLVPNAFKTIDNQLKCLIIHCFECIRHSAHVKCDV